MASVLKWPIIGWIVVDILLILVLYVDGVSHVMTPATLAPLALAFGVWVGYKTVDGGGSFSSAIINGAIVGAVCGVLTLLMGAIHAMDNREVFVFALAVYFAVLNISGAVVGGGFLLTNGAQSSASGGSSRGVGGDGGGSGGGGGM